MGTAGHVDHGKTALIKALTGIDCDTHREEKTRGITINLGFAHIELPTGDSLGIVDVPGHRDFVHTMVGGASGLDLVLLAVAADSGVMPQTLEHLHIMDVLGIRDGLIALTKVDLVEPELIAMAEDEVRELVRGTFLADREIIRVSAVTGEGMDALRAALAQVAARLRDRPAGQVFRLFPDRVFTVSGFGSVVTGSVLGGSLETGATAYLLPGDQKLRVRRLERHGQQVDAVVAGDRASINLVGLDRQDVRRGMVLADRVLNATTLADARLRVFEQSRSFGLWTQAVFHVGTYEQQARVHLIDHDRLMPGETGLVQVHLSAPCVLQYGDRFVIRSTSNDATLGGGEIIDPAPLHHRRRTSGVVEGMTRIAEGERPALVASEIRKRFRPISHVEIADILNVSADEVRVVVEQGLPEDIVVRSTGSQTFFLVKREYDKLQDRMLKILMWRHKRNPLEEKGRTTEELAGRLGVEPGSSAGTMLRLLLEGLESDGKLKRVAHTWALVDHKVAPDTELKARIAAVENYLRSCRMQTPLVSELRRTAEREGMKEHDLDHILRYLVEQGKAYFFEDSYLHAEIVDRCRMQLLRGLEQHAEGMTVAQFRDLTHGNRKICLLLLGIYDAEGVTERRGDLRVLTDKGREALHAGARRA